MNRVCVLLAKSVRSDTPPPKKFTRHPDKSLSGGDCPPRLSRRGDTGERNRLTGTEIHRT